MGLLNKVANKLGLSKRRYYTLMVRQKDYLSVKVLAAQQKMTLVDFVHELVTIYLGCKNQKHELIIADLLKKQDALVDELMLYRERIGKIYRSPADKIAKSPQNKEVK